MPRDHRKLKVFEMSDNLILDIYNATRHFPKEEIYGLTSQIRRAAVSVAANIVEGSARNSLRDYLHYLNIAYASLKETGYLISLSRRLGYLSEVEYDKMNDQFDNLSRALNALIGSLNRSSKKESGK